MIRECKKLVTDIGRQADMENKLPEYIRTLGKQYNFYAVVKMCMNYYTMKSMLEDENCYAEGDVAKIFESISKLIEKYIVGDETIDEKIIGDIDGIREKVEYKMRNLSAYTDGLQIYEYILNRVEAKVKGHVEPVDTDLLASRMFAYVFQENDTVVINSKLKLLIEQLPVRMTKNKFYDVVTNTLTIYKGGDKNSVDEFVQMLKTAVLIEKPAGFETEYPYLYSVYNNLKIADYSALDADSFDRLMDSLNDAASKINEEASAYMLLQEIVNDVYTILLTHADGKISNRGEVGYGAALQILSDSTRDLSVDELTEKLMSKFVLLEGVQEQVYETVMVLETAFDDIRKGNAELVEKLNLAEYVSKLDKAQKLLSTSLFIDLNKDFAPSEYEVADNDYIMALRDEMVEALKNLFADNSRQVNRSIMSKLLGSMPIFLNSQQDIKSYFEYVLNNCNDDSELFACAKLVDEIIEE